MSTPKNPSCFSTKEVLEAEDGGVFEVASHGPAPEGDIPLTADMLTHRPSGDAFGMTEDAGMGWDPSALAGPQFVMLSTMGGIRASDGHPIALAHHTGNYELGLALQAAAEQFKQAGAVPYAAYCSDPCDGRTQGTPGMFDSLAYRNDAAIVMRRQARSIPTARGILGAATCDKGLPAMMMALASFRQRPCVLVPGGVTLPPIEGEDTGKVQSIGARFARGELSLAEARKRGCQVCASAGGGCHFFGTAASSQVVAEALGLALPHSALAPSGQPIWLDMARRSAKALMSLAASGVVTEQIVTQDAIHNAMVVHAAFGGSTNLVLHIPAIAHSAGLKRPTIEDWTEINRDVPRLVDVLPNGPKNHPTLQAYLAGGVPEVMLHLRELDLLRLDVLTVAGLSLGEVLQWWEKSSRRQTLRQRLAEGDGVDPEEVIFSPARAAEMGVTSTTCFPRGNLAPEGSVIKSTAIDPKVLDDDGVYRKTGPARVFVRETDAVAAVKGTTDRPIQPGDVIILICRGPMGTGMEETYQLTSALKYLSFGPEVALVTDARFSGVSTGACIGMVGPEALAGGPIGKLRDGDRIRIVVNPIRLEGTVDFVGDEETDYTSESAAEVLAHRVPRDDLSSDPLLPPETQLWAQLQRAGGGAWGGCVYDADRISLLMAAGRKAMEA